MLQVDDLLRLKNNNLRIKPKGVGTEVEGLTRTRCNSAEELLQLLETGRRNIIYAETKMNKSSSRSHAVLQMYVTRRARILEGLGSNSGLSASLRLGGDVQATQLTGKLSLVDLAGSERVKRSGADEEKTGKRMKEAININTSLLGLSNVMKALGQAASHVPYRDSKLTHLLSDSLGGNCRTSLIVCASQASLDASETTGALDFGARAMQVKVSATVNSTTVTLDAAALADDLSTAMRLRAEGGVGGQLLQLEDQLRQREDALGKLTRQVAEAAAGRERDRAAAAAAAEQSNAAHNAMVAELERKLAAESAAAAAERQRAEAAAKRAEVAEGRAASAAAEAASLQAELSSKALAEATEHDGALKALEMACAAEAAAATEARHQAAAAAADGKVLIQRLREANAEAGRAQAAAAVASAETRAALAALLDADAEVAGGCEEAAARITLLQEACELQSTLRASAETDLSSSKAACRRLEEERDRSDAALQRAELARDGERTETQEQTAELIRSRDELEAAAEGLHATVASLQGQLSNAEGRAAEEAAARLEQVQSLRQSYDEALARLGVSEAEAEGLRQQCDEVLRALEESRRARLAEEATLRTALVEHETSLTRALADARAKSKALSALLEARKAESERAEGLASRAHAAEAAYAASEARVGELEASLAGASEERARLLEELDALTIARGLADGRLTESELARETEVRSLASSAEAREAEARASLDEAQRTAAVYKQELEAAAAEQRRSTEELRARLQRAALFGAAAEKQRHERAEAARGVASDAASRAAQAHASWSAALHAQKTALSRALGDARAEEMRHLREMLLTGVLAVKHGRKGKPHPRHIRCDLSLRRLEWGASAVAPAEKCLLADEVVAITPGLTTDVARRGAKAGSKASGKAGGRGRSAADLRDNLFLSVVSPTRTLDLEFRSAELRDAWLATLLKWREHVATGDLAPTRRQVRASSPSVASLRSDGDVAYIPGPQSDEVGLAKRPSSAGKRALQRAASAVAVGGGTGGSTGSPPLGPARSADVDEAIAEALAE